LPEAKTRHIGRSEWKSPDAYRLLLQKWPAVAEYDGHGSQARPIFPKNCIFLVIESSPLQPRWLNQFNSDLS
jgi:hypothetical protein